MKFYQRLEGGGSKIRSTWRLLVEKHIFVIYRILGELMISYMESLSSQDSMIIPDLFKGFVTHFIRPT